MAFAKTLTMGAAAAVLALAAGGASATSVKVGVLSRHDPAAWSSESQCLAGANLDLIQCNLEVYGAAVAEAAASQVELLVFPEGYGLSNTIARSGFFEPFDEATPFGTVQCTSAENATLPQQVALSCAAMKTGVALVANVFTQREEDGSRHITDIVYDGDGALVAWYHKHVLFPSEKKVVEPGPFAPTTFDLLGHRWGLLICYEGLCVRGRCCCCCCCCCPTTTNHQLTTQSPQVPEPHR